VTKARPSRCLWGTKTSDRARDQVFFESLDLLGLRGRDGIGTVNRRDTCFVNIIRPHRTPWLIRMAGGAITASWGDCRQSAWSAIARLVQYPETLRGFREVF
jgi:hypothetical protein